MHYILTTNNGLIVKTHKRSPNIFNILLNACFKDFWYTNTNKTHTPLSLFKL